MCGLYSYNFVPSRLVSWQEGQKTMGAGKKLHHTPHFMESWWKGYRTRAI